MLLYSQILLLFSTLTATLEETAKTISEPVTHEELNMLDTFGLVDGDGMIEKFEFLILCMVRTGTSPRLINFIVNRFRELDQDHSGKLSISEITSMKQSTLLQSFLSEHTMNAHNQRMQEQQKQEFEMMNNNPITRVEIKKASPVRKVAGNRPPNNQYQNNQNGSSIHF